MSFSLLNGRAPPSSAAATASTIESINKVRHNLSELSQEIKIFLDLSRTQCEEPQQLSPEAFSNVRIVDRRTKKVGVNTVSW
jgi:hypothetical protein